MTDDPSNALLMPSLLLVQRLQYFDARVALLFAFKVTRSKMCAQQRVRCLISRVVRKGHRAVAYAVFKFRWILMQPRFPPSAVLAGVVHNPF